MLSMLECQTLRWSFYLCFYAFSKYQFQVPRKHFTLISMKAFLPICSAKYWRCPLIHDPKWMCDAVLYFQPETCILCQLHVVATAGQFYGLWGYRITLTLVYGQKGEIFSPEGHELPILIKPPFQQKPEFLIANITSHRNT